MWLIKLEDAMKVSLSLLSVVLAGSVLVAIPLGVRQTTAEAAQTPAAKKETKWQGTVLRINKDSSELVIRGGINSNASDERKISYDSSTEWTNLGKPGKMEEVKEGSFVIVLGQVDGKGVLHATRIDLRKPR